MPVPEKLIFEYSHAGRGASDQWPHDPGPAALAELPLTLRRARPPELPEVGELEAVRHFTRSEEHTSELQSPCNLVCRLLLEKKNKHALMDRSSTSLPASPL